MAQTNTDYVGMVYSFFHNKGLPDAGIGAVLGNWKVESGVTPTSENQSEQAIGFANWEGGRRTALQSLATRMHSTETDPVVQLNFAWQELNSPAYSGVLDNLRKATNPSDAAAYFDEHYEVSSGAARSQRESFAQDFFTQLKGGGIKLVADVKSIVAPPYPKTPNAPYNAAQRKSMVAWIEAYLAAGKINGVLDPKDKANFLAGKDDKGLHDFYAQYLGSYQAGDGGGLQPPNDPPIASTPSLPQILQAIVEPIKFIGTFFKDLAWIFNVSHFIKFMLYLGGGIFALSGLMLVIFGSGKDRPA